MDERRWGKEQAGLVYAIMQVACAARVVAFEGNEFDWPDDGDIEQERDESSLDEDLSYTLRGFLEGSVPPEVHGRKF